MNTNLLLLELHWMTGNQADIKFKNSKAGKSIKIKRVSNALGFVGLLAQLSIALGLSDYQNSELKLNNNNKKSQWLLTYHLALGILKLQILFNNGFTKNENSVFSWTGAVRDFRQSVDRFIRMLPKYRFFDHVAATVTPKIFFVIPNDTSIIPNRSLVMPNRSEVSLG